MEFTEKRKIYTDQHKRIRLLNVGGKDTEARISPCGGGALEYMPSAPVS